MENNAKVGGILSIVSGAFGILMGCLMIWLFKFLVNMPQGTTSPAFPFPFRLMAVIYGAIGIAIALVGVLAIVGGAFAMKRKHWGWALAGAIGGNLVFCLCGIPALIFVCLGKAEFTRPWLV